jgi:glycosyltransferase involved in cell wall biosynthesis
MNKPTIVISCPIDTYSGYGARSRDIVKSLLNTNKYDVKVLSQRWGNTSTGFLKDHNLTELENTIIPNLTAKPDIWMQITVPNEFQAVGTYNIGITAGIETTICDPSWIIGCNRMNLILTSSTHSKDVFERTKFDQKDNNGVTTSKLKLTSKVEVLFEGVDLDTYLVKKSNIDLSTIEESFAFLFVGTWLQGDFGHDRKNIGYLIKSFLETFKNKKNSPALILKTGLGTSSHMNTDVLLRRIDNITKTVKGKTPNIYLIDGDMSDEEVNELYNHPKVKAMISLTKGEGFGRPLLEFTTTGKPIIASGWSGQVDFLDREFSTLIGGTLEPVHESAVQKNIILAESSWFRPNDAEVNAAFKAVHKDYKKYKELAKRQAYKTKKEFSFDAMQSLLDRILTENLPEFPKQVELKLPKLDLPKLQ